MRRLACAILTIVTMQGCASAQRGPSRADQAAAIRMVLEADEELGRARNHASEQNPISIAADWYVESLEALDLSATPPEFAAAWRVHIAAWDAAVEPLDAFRNLRGEMHDVLDEISAMNTPQSRAVDAAIEEVWATWAEVERVLTQLGVTTDGEVANE